MPSRRVLLRALGAGLLASAAGCSGSDSPDEESAPSRTTETATTSESTTGTVYEETSIMPSLTATTTDTVSTTASTTEATVTTAGTVETTDRADSQSSSGNGGTGGTEPRDDNDSEPTAERPTSTDTATTTEGPPTSATPTTKPPTSTTASTTKTEETTSSTETTTSAEPTTTTETTTTTEPTTTTETTTTTERRRDGNGSWSTEPDLPAPQSDAGGGVVDGILYYFGGIESGENLPAVARTYRFDPAAGGGDGAWRRLADMPRALWAPCGIAAEGRVYSFGGAPKDAPYGTGEPPSDEIFVYEPGEGWRDLSAETGVRCPYPNWAMGGVYDPDEGLVYLVGGGTDATDRESASDHGVGTDGPGTFDESRVWTFDPTTEEVANPDLARLPRARRWPTVALVEVDGEKCLHTICGLFGVTGPTNENLRYRLSSDEWSAMTPAPRSGSYATTSDPVVGGTIYLTHGFFWEDSPSVDAYAPACHAYDPDADEFRTDLARPRQLRGGSVDAVVGDTLYVVGGHVKRYDQNGFHDCKTSSETFTPTN